MSKPSEPIARPGRAWADLCVTRLAVLALAAPLFALAGVTTSEPKDAARPVAATEKTATPAGAYQIRCWQYGHLLFEENQIALPADNSQYSLKVSGTDRKGQPIYVAETKNATCLIRHASHERTWPANPR